MLDRESQKYPKVGVFLLVVSDEGKWFWEDKNGEQTLPFQELLGGSSWESAAKSLRKRLGLESKNLSFFGVGSGFGSEHESWVYSVFQIREIPEASLGVGEWLYPEKVKKIDSLIRPIQEAYLKNKT